MRQSTIDNMGTQQQQQQQYSDDNIQQNGGNNNNNNTAANNNNNNNSKPIIERGASWGLGETKILLALWSQDMVQRQLTNSKRTRHVWEKIAERIREHGHDRTADQVRTRVFNMIAEYRRIMKNPTPERRKKCIFFDALHRIYQAKDTNSLENVIMTMNYMIDNNNSNSNNNNNNGGNVSSSSNLNENYNFDPLDFSNINDGNNDSQAESQMGDEQNNSGSGDDLDDERNNEMLVFPLSPNTYAASNNINNDDDDDTNFNYDDSSFLPQTKRFRSDFETNGHHHNNNINAHNHNFNNNNHHHNHISTTTTTLDSTASALLIDRMFTHLSKETEVMREWVNLERERLAQEVARRKEEKEREERREKIFLDVLTKLQERIFTVLKDYDHHHHFYQQQQQQQQNTNKQSIDSSNDQSSSSQQQQQQQQIPSSSSSSSTTTTTTSNLNQTE